MGHDSIILKEILRPVLFWDVDLAGLDLDVHAAYVIRRVMEHGNRDEVRAVWRYFGAETIKHHLLSARSLSPKTVSYFANIFNISRSQFRTHISDKAKTWP